LTLSLVGAQQSSKFIYVFV